MRLLLVEDKAGMRDMLTRALGREGYEVTAHADAEAGITALYERPFDIVLTDLKLPGKDGIEVLKAAKEVHPDLPVVVMTAFGSIESAVSAMREGAYDFIPKPFDPDHLTLVLGKAAQARRLVTENRVLRQTARHLAPPAIVGRSAALAAAMDQARKVAAAETTVLLVGESGTGKELFAELVHAESPRHDGPFIAVNCAAVPHHLLESEFFGHEKGAFTGAEARRLGKFELAAGGTIFLDEIGDMDTGLQAKLLRVLQDGEVVRVGGERAVPLDVRVVAATNQDLPARIADGRFREDLYYRLSAFPVRIPPLRERREDIPELVLHFVRRFGRELRREAAEVAPETMQRLVAYDWPGNVRELQNCIERAVILSAGPVLEHVDLGVDARPKSGAGAPDLSLDGPLAEVSARAVRHYESAKIRQVLDLTGGNKSRAAEVLKVSYKTLLTKIKEYAIEPVDMCAPPDGRGSAV
jgi:DNA-binding NtrC family response regulator